MFMTDLLTYFFSYSRWIPQNNWQRCCPRKTISTYHHRRTYGFINHIYPSRSQTQIWSTSWCGDCRWGIGYWSALLCFSVSTYHWHSTPSAAVYSARYISDRFLPDKAIDLVDEAASALRLAQESKPDALEALEREIVTLQIELESLKKETDVFSVERRSKVESDLALKKDEASVLTREWQAGEEFQHIYHL